MLNAYFFLQLLGLLLLLFFYHTLNIFTYWYLSGLYLIVLGLLLLLREADIFVGFLWVIDFGVGLIFFVFILHLTQFLFQKSAINLFSEKFNLFSIIAIWLTIFFFVFASAESSLVFTQITKIWFFFLSWNDYYENFFSTTIIDLQLLKELYFSSNSFEFFVINFLIAYAIFTAIEFSFLLKKISTSAYYWNLIKFIPNGTTYSNLFIRNQNFIKQQTTSTGTRAWQKNSSQIKNDF